MTDKSVTIVFTEMEDTKMKALEFVMTTQCDYQKIVNEKKICECPGCIKPGEECKHVVGCSARKVGLEW